LVHSAEGQYLLEEFKPKIKGIPSTARHIFQDDGKIVLLGDYAFVGNTPVANLLRFNPDGSLDQDFILSNELRDQFTTDFRQCCTRPNLIAGPDGDLVLLAAGFRSRATIIDESGKFKLDIALPAGGYYQFDRLVRYKDGYIASANMMFSGSSIFMLDQNGNVDSDFTRLDYTGHIEEMVVDPNNNVFIAGDLTVAGIPRKLVKINEAGVLDETFYNASIPISFSEIDFFPDGKIVVSADNEIVLLDATGKKIESFIPETGGERIYSSVIDPVNNRIIILLEQYPSPVTIKALALDGSISDLFTPINIGSYGNALARISRAGQKFVLTTGFEIEYGTSVQSFLVFDAKGTVDTKISTKEKLFSVGQVNAAVELEDGSIVIGGEFTHIENTQVNNLAKIDRSGNVNLVFTGHNPLSISDIVREIKISPDKQLYVGGFFHNILGISTNSLIRMNADGELDKSFATTLTSWASGSFLNDFIIMSDRIIACGYYYGGVVAFDFHGNTVPTFNTNIFGSQYVSAGTLYKVDEDNFAMGNVLNDKGFLWIMDSDGNIDHSFVQHNDIPISSYHMVKVGNELYRSGHILGGQTGNDGNFIFKYNLETGVIDSSNFVTYTISVNHHFLPLNDSMAVISGEFDHFSNTVANNFAVSDYEGAADKRFNFQISPGIKGHFLEKTVSLSGEKILLLGKFDKINDVPFYSIAILNYTNFKPQVDVKESYTISEDTIFYLSDLVEIIDMDDELDIRAENNDNLTIGEDGLVTLKQDFTGSIPLQFSVADPFAEAGPFTTTFEVKPVNDAPVIKDQIEIPAILPGEKYEIGFGILDVIDVEGDNLTMIVREGENYTLAGGNSIQSDKDFSGFLNIGVSVSDGWLTSEEFMLKVISGHPTGVDEVLNLSFYPNPFADYIAINAWENVERLTIRSITGQEFVQHNYSYLKATSGIIPTKLIPNGVFLLSVVLKNKELRHIKLIKN
jgi:hypothetical protein